MDSQSIVSLLLTFLRKNLIAAGRPNVSNSYKDYHMTSIIPRQREWTFRRIVVLLFIEPWQLPGA